MTGGRVAIVVAILLGGLSVGPAAHQELTTGAPVRDAAFWPFDERSPWNHPIGSAAVYQPVTNPRWNPSSGGYANIEWYSIPTYVAEPTHPFRAIYDRRSLSSSGPAVMLRVPDEATAARGTDGHLNIIDEAHRFVYELYHAVRLPGGDLQTAGLIKNDLYGPGGGFSGWHGSVAAGTSSLGGVIRVGELTVGTAGLRTGIRHALQGVAPVDSLNRRAPSSGPCPGSSCRPFVWPASSADGSALKGTGYDTQGNAYMGSLLAIPPRVEITRLGITDPQALEVARALQDYGIYIIDQGSTGGKLVIRIDPQAARDIANRDTFVQGLNLAVRALMLVSNSHAAGWAPATPGGGGVPRRPLAPPLP